MANQPEEIKRKFSLEVRGYSRQEVDAFVAEVDKHLDGAPNAGGAGVTKRLGDAVSEVLGVATESAEALLKEAETESKAIRSNARIEAETLAQEAREKAEATESSAKRKADRLLRDAEEESTSRKAVAEREAGETIRRASEEAHRMLESAELESRELLKAATARRHRFEAHERAIRARIEKATGALHTIQGALEDMRSEFAAAPEVAPAEFPGFGEELEPAADKPSDKVIKIEEFS